MKRFLRTVLILAVLAIVGIAAIAGVGKYVKSFSDGRIQTSITEIPVDEPKRVAIILGARVQPDGSLSHSLYDRVITAVELYRAGRVKKLLMTGDRQNDEYDEPAAMKRTAIEMGVAAEDIFIDNDGKRTYDSCYRANEIYEIKSAIIVTQDYHQPRAIYLCSAFGIDSIGINANLRKYVREDYFNFREFFSRPGAWFEVNIYGFEQVKGDKQPIGQ